MIRTAITKYRKSKNILIEGTPIPNAKEIAKELSISYSILLAIFTKDFTCDETVEATAEQFTFTYEFKFKNMEEKFSIWNSFYIDDTLLLSLEDCKKIAKDKAIDMLYNDILYAINDLKRACEC